MEWVGWGGLGRASIDFSEYLYIELCWIYKAHLIRVLLCPWRLGFDLVPLGRIA